MEKLTKIIDLIKVLMDKRFTGSIKINFSSGTVRKIEKFEEILKK